MNVLFVGHSAERTGAPILMLNLMRWISARTRHKPLALLRSGGSLISEFERVAPTRLFNETSHRTGWKSRKVFARLSAADDRRRRARLLDHYRQAGISLVYSNTITNGEVLEFLSPLGCPVVTHVHELQYWIQHSGTANLENVKRHTNHYIVASEAVRRNLIQNVRIPDDQMTTVYEYVSRDEAANVDSNARAVIREKLGIPESAFVVVGSGAESWRKGKDLFVRLAALVRDRRPEVQVCFLWVGAWDHPDRKAEIDHDIRCLGLGSQLLFVGEVENPLEFFAASDAFAMVSREDPFPLVCLEAASLGLPVLCFDKAGGIPEFVQGERGFVAPYLDLSAMTDRILQLIASPELRRRIGEAAATAVRERFTIEQAGPAILQVMNDQVEKAAKQGIAP